MTTTGRQSGRQSSAANPSACCSRISRLRSAWTARGGRCASRAGRRAPRGAGCLVPRAEQASLVCRQTTWSPADHRRSGRVPPHRRATPRCRRHRMQPTSLEPRRESRQPDQRRLPSPLPAWPPPWHLPPLRQQPPPLQPMAPASRRRVDLAAIWCRPQRLLCSVSRRVSRARRSASRSESWQPPHPVSRAQWPTTTQARCPTMSLQCYSH